MNYNEVTLTSGYKLKGYLIKEVLGTGSHGITYLATDIMLDKKVVIKEYFPNNISIRQNSTITPKSLSDQENFEYGLEQFIHIIKNIASIKHPNVVRINQLFEMNNTAYFVMDYEEGETLQSCINKKSSFSEEEILNIMMPILDGLDAVHKSNFLHRDINPNNIFLREDGLPLLIELESTFKYFLARRPSHIFYPGYAPKEQYSSTSKQGAYTDLYAIGAVMYKIATGTTPIEADVRIDAITDDEPDPFVTLQSRSDLNYSNSFKKIVDWTLEIKAKNRPKSVDELRQVLESKSLTLCKE